LAFIQFSSVLSYIRIIPLYVLIKFYNMFKLDFITYCDILYIMNIHSSFGAQLRQLRAKKNITQKELALKLGIGQTAIANYENGKRFPDEQILISIADFFRVTIDHLLSRKQLPKERPSGISRGFEYSPSELKQRCGDFMTASLESGRKGSSIIMNLLETGYSEEQIIIDLLEASLLRTGFLWEEGVYNEAMEHQLSSTVLQALIMMQLKSGYLVPFRGKAACLTTAGENHNLGLRMMSRFLEIDGWDSFFLGSSVPARSLQDYIRDIEIDLVLVSVTLNENADSGCSLIKVLKSMDSPPSVIAGGRGIKHNEKIFLRSGADYLAKTASDAVFWARNVKRLSDI